MPVQLMDADATREVKDSELPNVPDGDEKTIYTVRSITKATYREVTKRHTKKVVSKRDRGMVEETNWQAVSDDLLDYALVGWTCVVLRGDPVPCTMEYKALLDSVRSQALLDAAGIGQVEAAAAQRKASFREPAHVA